MVGVGLWIRLGILETPVFQRIVAEERIVKAPALEVIRLQWRQILLTAFARMAEQGPGYIYGAFIFTYGATVLQAPRNLLLSGLLTAAILGFCWVTISGALSDRIGRKRMYMIGAVFSGLFGFVYFALLDTKSPTLIFVAMALSLLPVMTLYGPQAALIAESFAPRLRYSGAGIGYQFASVVAGGPAPFIATALFAAYHSSFPIALYILGCGFISIIAASMLKDYTGKDISQDYEGVDVERAPATLR